MPRLSVYQLGERARERRGANGLRETAAEIGVSAATLSRIERGHMPDLDTFGKLCRWLDVDPADVLDVPVQRGTASNSPPVFTATAHFRVNQTTSEELARALGALIVAAHRMLQDRSA